MDGQEYLNQISAENRSVNAGGKFSNILSSKLFLAGIIVVVLFIAMAIFGAVMSGSRGSEKDLAIALKLRLDNTSEVISNYRPNVKSSFLRSRSAALTNVFSDTNKELTNYLVGKYNFEEKNVQQKVIDEATLEKDDLDADLFEAKINGMLDQTYASKITYEIAIIMNEETRIYNSTKDEVLRQIMDSSYTSLENLYNDFNNFSEAE